MSPAVLSLPVRGSHVRDLGLRLPPDRMPLLRQRRPLKRWRYVGVYGPDLMLCVGAARVGFLPLNFWAIAEPGRPLAEQTSLRGGGVRIDATHVSVAAGDARIELTLSPREGFDPIEVVSGSGAGYIWTRKDVALAHGAVEIAGRRYDVAQEAFIDDSAGYHQRHTAWKWSAGVGRGAGGEQVAWNLVTGVHDSPQASERTVWVDGRPVEVGPVSFSPDLSGVEFAEGGSLRFTEWAARTDDTNLLLFRSRYRQPFGTFAGRLPGGLHLSEGYGVMEDHDVLW